MGTGGIAPHTLTWVLGGREWLASPSHHFTSDLEAVMKRIPTLARRLVHCTGSFAMCVAPLLLVCWDEGHSAKLHGILTVTSSGNPEGCGGSRKISRSLQSCNGLCGDGDNFRPVKLVSRGNLYDYIVHGRFLLFTGKMTKRMIRCDECRSYVMQSYQEGGKYTTTNNDQSLIGNETYNVIIKVKLSL
jgi:hypothetical protein